MIHSADIYGLILQTYNKKKTILSFMLHGVSYSRSYLKYLYVYGNT
jgi:hypothetical protein